MFLWCWTMQIVYFTKYSRPHFIYAITTFLNSLCLYQDNSKKPKAAWCFHYSLMLVGFPINLLLFWISLILVMVYASSCRFANDLSWTLKRHLSIYIPTSPWNRNARCQFQFYFLFAAFSCIILVSSKS